MGREPAALQFCVCVGYGGGPKWQAQIPQAVAQVGEAALLYENAPPLWICGLALAGSREGGQGGFRQPARGKLHILRDRGVEQR